MDKPRALLVEAHSELRYYYGWLLREQAGCEVHAVGTTEEARSFLESGNDVQVVVTHVYFPDKKQNADYKIAAEFCQFIRKSRGDSIPIIGLQTIPVDDQFLADAGFPADIIPWFISFHSPKDFVRRVKDFVHGTPV